MSAIDSHFAAHQQRVVKCSVGETTPKGDWNLVYQLGKGGNGVVFLVRQGRSKWGADASERRCRDG